MNKSIKDIISKEFQKNGMIQSNADILGYQAESVYNRNKDYLDFDFVEQFGSAGYESQMDRLTELAYVDFLSKNEYKLKTTKGNKKASSNLDIIIKNLGSGEFNCLHYNKNLNTPEDLKLRLMQGLDKKIVKTWMEIKKGSITKTQPVILFYCYSDLLDKSALPIIVNDVHKDKIPLEFECVCGQPFKKQNGNEVHARYFVDKTKWIGTDNKEILENKNNFYKLRKQIDKDGNVIKDKHGNDRYEVFVDMTYISAVVFSPFITNSVFNEALNNTDDCYWNNDLILIHNPNARNSIKKKPFPTHWEYIVNKNRIKDGYMITCKEIHDKTN